jgi:four helix bundle protein
MQDFRKLSVWKKAHRLTLNVYELTSDFPDDERYGLISQMRRSSASIGANIAEGCGSGSDADFARFVQMALRSASELEYQLLLARDLTMLSEKPHRAATHHTQEVKRMLSGLLEKLRA